ncbi:hypothetical protein KP509_37G008500 [Ceratopteris richardii]|uniref:Uncharacterized protein n=1 Tax=Ceratopteris richardii TaxID=49495 RepID=A0A8T2Q590_CERRI|nr:hypothetical protein KP509_37G008500 [Ceratopteris richardii]KAH7279168.1 hypothetical protein KP509_37G008500 [Ceratopteris richardii]KAH7279169.1 hypothetical protein KP509_37G008500 [Ceratopteris richardii]
MGCNYSKLDGADVVARCKERKKLLKNVVRLRRKFASAHVAYIQILMHLGPAISLYAIRSPLNMKLPHSEKEGDKSLPLTEEVISSRTTPPSPSAAKSRPLASPSINSSSAKPASVSPSKKTSPWASSNPNIEKASKSISRPVKEEHVPVPSSLRSPVGPISEDFFAFSMPSSPVHLATNSALQQTSSPKNSDWDFFNLFSVQPSNSPWTMSRRYQDWSPNVDSQSFIYTAADDMPELEEADSGLSDLGEIDPSFKVETFPRENVSVEQNNQKINNMRKPDDSAMKQPGLISANALEKIDEETSSSSTVIDPDVNGESNGKESSKADGGVDVAVCVKQVDECISRLTGAFKDAAESGNEVSQILETQIAVSRLRDFSDSSRFFVMNGWQWPRKSSSKRVDLYDSDDDKEHDAYGIHSLTLEKLYTWERKLYKEVKAEKELHIAFLRKCRELNEMNEKEEDTNAFEQCRAVMKSLESRLAVAFKAISSISARIQRLTQEELYPQLLELLRRLKLMWKAMHKVHVTQKEAAEEIAIRTTEQHTFSATEFHVNAASELINQLKAWQQHFCMWVLSQQKYIETLLRWVQVCHMETHSNLRRRRPSDPNPPLELAATPIYQLAKKWHNSLLTLEKNTELIAAINVFISAVHDVQVGEYEEIVQTRKADLTQRRANHRARKENDNTRENDKSNGEDAILASLKRCLPHLFEALSAFSLAASQEYEKLHEHADPRTVTA